MTDSRGDGLEGCCEPVEVGWRGFEGQPLTPGNLRIAKKKSYQQHPRSCREGFPLEKGVTWQKTLPGQKLKLDHPPRLDHTGEGV